MDRSGEPLYHRLHFINHIPIVCTSCEFSCILITILHFQMFCYLFLLEQSKKLQLCLSPEFIKEVYQELIHILTLTQKLRTFTKMPKTETPSQCINGCSYQVRKLVDFTGHFRKYHSKKYEELKQKLVV